MYEDRLFFTGFRNNTIEDYKNFIDEIYNDKPLSRKRELEPYRKNIKYLLNLYPVDELIDAPFEYWQPYVDKVVYLSTFLGRKPINRRLVTTILHTTYFPKPIELMDCLVSLYNPKIIVKADSFSKYLDLCSDLCNHFFHDFFEKEKNDINTGDRDLDELYKTLLDLQKEGFRPRFLYDERRMITLIFSYFHLNSHLNYIEIDFSLIKEYFHNLTYYKDKMNMNNCNIEVLSRIGNNKTYDYKAAIDIFHNMEAFFTRESIAIR